VPSSRQRVSNGDCQRIRGNVIRTVVLCTTVVDSDSHSHGQFLKLTLGFGFV